MTRFNHQDGRTHHIDDAALYYEQQGNPDGPALVFLHGGHGTLATFNFITEHLSEHYHLIGIDSRGHGRSTLGSDPLSYQRLQQDVESLIDHLQLDSVSIIGHSDGAIVGLRLAAAKVINIDRLVTIGAHWALKADDPAHRLYTGITADKWRGMFAEEVQRYELMNPKPDFDTLMDAVRAMWLDTSETGYPGERVRDINADLLVIRGDSDHLVSRINAVELAERVPSAQLLNLPFADHSPHETHAQWLLPVLEKFLQAQ